MMIKENRSLIMYILLTIITCGLYSLYFIYKLAEDVNVICADDGKQTTGLLLYLLLTLVTCGLYTFYWMYSLGNRLCQNAPRYGLTFQENGTTVLLWQVFGSLLCGVGALVAWNIIIKNTNVLAREYNNWCRSLEAQ